MKQNRRSVCLFILTICLSGFFLLPSCVLRPTVTPQKDKRIHWEEKKPKEILNKLRQEQKQITDFTAGFSILLDPPPKGQPSNLQGVLFYASSPKGPFIRIKSIGAFGRVMFDLVQKQDTVQIYIPSRQTLYSGQMKKDNGNAWQEIFTSMFPDFSLMTVPQNADLIIEKKWVILPLTGGAFYLNRENGIVQKWTQGKRVIYFEDYISSPGHPPFPTRIYATSSDNLNKASCVFSQVQINTGINHVFDLSGYHPKFKRDINELTR